MAVLGRKLAAVRLADGKTHELLDVDRRDRIRMTEDGLYVVRLNAVRLVIYPCR